jgi:hypothetical protein
MSNKQTTACEHCEGLRARNDWLENQLAIWDPIHAIRRALPSDAEAAALLKIVCGRYPHLRENSGPQESIDNFLCALAYIFSLTQTKQPTVAYQGSWWATEGNMWATNARLRGRVRTLIPAIIATGSIPFMLDHSAIYLDPHRARGTAVDNTSWRRVLAAADLLQAVPVKQTVDASIGFRQQIPSW